MTDMPPPVGARVSPTQLGMDNSCDFLRPTDRGAVTEVHLNPDKNTPLDEGVWGLLDAYDQQYPDWIARVVWYDNPDAPELVGPGEIEETHD